MVVGVSSSVAGTAAAVQTTGGTAAGAAFASSDFETFLKMLTTQIKNQDPLNPMEGTEFAVQLATFSGVEQQVLTNQLLGQLLQGSSSGLGDLSGWIGREVRTDAPVWYDQSPLTLNVHPMAGADEVTLVAHDAQGNEVSRESIGTGAGEVDWQGRDADGEPLPAGAYQFRIESLADGEVIGMAVVEAYTRVTGAEIVNGWPRLILTGGATAGLDEITALRE
ncbi:flagellar basal-body rod modification protein FlgD [Paracoccus halophilus]|uniref:Basal-body rod modification protein FlgD n=1 Tax=Paracoccus halophilus TaxID=376733 RepID=A0A099EZ73_9RHOB|nr:flagellar hook capping FlgD N-terminal domain-containing protein [Paracoccus halophilus]KGJ03494.1 flagellar basal body rod modification protein [Paracoccus halophilus]SFA57657.1 flagellar basal-body rod modification protein FlgD [Paracoccus halophilus]